MTKLETFLICLPLQNPSKEFDSGCCGRAAQHIRVHFCRKGVPSEIKNKHLNTAYKEVVGTHFNLHSSPSTCFQVTEL